MPHSEKREKQQRRREILRVKESVGVTERGYRARSRLQQDVLARSGKVQRPTPA